MSTQTHITRETVPEHLRMATTTGLFGNYFPMVLEPVFYSFADKLSEDYHGGYWEFYVLSNGGFYMAPLSDQRFHVTCDNQFEGDLSADALGITPVSMRTATCRSLQYPGWPTPATSSTTCCGSTCLSIRRSGRS